MKKNLFLAALASVALASCVNDESNAIVDAPQPLRFDAPVMTTQTRANVKGEITSSYPKGEDFNVFCIKYKGSFDGWENSTDVSSFFNPNGEVASHDDATSYWDTETVHTWPLATYNLAFAAYSPAELNGAASVTYDKSGLKIENFTTESSSDNQYDLMYSERIVDRNNTNNGNTAVNINFCHALSNIVFSASKGSDNSKTYEITEIKVVGSFHTTGNFSQNITETKATPTEKYKEESAPSWSLPTTPPSQTTYTPTFTDFTVSTTPTIFTGEESALLLIPQTVPADAKVLLSFTKKETGLTDVVYTDYEIPLNEFKIGSNPISTWARGYKYNYRIYFGGTPKIFFKPEVQAWEDGGVAIYEVK